MGADFNTQDIAAIIFEPPPQLPMKISGGSIYRAIIFRAPSTRNFEL